MATLLNLDIVQYQCTCKEWLPLAKLYFCRHCTVLRCASCAAHEVDSIYCPHCLENMPSAEARLKKNKCSNCFDCPWCGNALATRASNLLDPTRQAEDQSPEKGPGTGKKVYYLSCLFCRWSSRSAGIPDQTVPTSSWPELENKNAPVLNNVLDHFRQLAFVERNERERKKYTKRRSHFPFYAEKYGFQHFLNVRRMAAGQSDKEQNDTKTKEFIGVEPSEDVESLSDDFFTKELRLEEITTIEQRLRNPDYQPVFLKDLHPQRKQLMCKRSQRCKACEHNLCKPEFSPTSSKFKIQLCALFHVPEIRLMKPVTLVAGQEQDVFLTISNLTAALVHVAFLPNVEACDGAYVSFEGPHTELAIPVKDDTAEFEDEKEQAPAKSLNDNDGTIIFQRGHKLGLRISVKVIPEQVEQDLWLSFIIKYDYVNTLMHLIGEQKELNILWLQQKVKIHLGKAAAAKSA